MHEELSEILAGLDAKEGIQTLTTRNPGKVIFTTSFSMEDQVITDLIVKNGGTESQIRIATLDTGRMFEETYKVFSQTVSRYGSIIEVFFPDADQVEQLVHKKGPFSFYASVENRKECCNIRKVLPLKRALEGAEWWITGIRAEHSPNRQHMPMVEWDEINQVYKYHPLLHWTWEEVKSYISVQGIPYNTLYDKGFQSIGCAPCTRAVREGDDPRSGRWWWEQGSGKECGLHAIQK